MKHRLFFRTAATVSAMLLAVSPAQAELMHLNFNEGSGIAVTDASGNLAEAELKYRYTKPLFTEPKDPEWRVSGIEGGSLLFDGSSNFIAYEPEEFTASGDQLTIDVWVAPRAFEWDPPEAAANGEHHLTAIVSQYSKVNGQGILLGYQRYGRLCFEVGAEDGWHTVWGSNLEKDAWNHVTAVFDGKEGRISLYLNGALVGEDAVAVGSSIVPADREKFLVGKNSNGEQIGAGDYQMFSGLMDELTLTETAVYPAEESITAPEIAYEDIGLANILTDDDFKPQYHGGPYQHWMNEPHAPLYYNGMYHLFFQQNMVGSYWRNIQWGHLVSTDMVNWRPVKEAIVPTENTVVPDGVWSGNAAYDANGVPMLFFTAGNDSFAKEGMISNQNIGIAYPADLSDPNLTDWVIYDQLAVEQQRGEGRPGEFRDPYLWQHDGKWYMLICSGSAETKGGAALLYVSDRLELKEDGTIDMDWQYVSSVYEMENQTATYGTSWELPILMPLTNEAGTVTKDIFMISPAPAGLADNKVYFFLGNFDYETGKFTPDEAYQNKPGLIDYGDNVFTGPSAMVDPVSGKVCVFSIMQDKRSGAKEGAAGWAHSVGLTRNIWLNDDGTDVMVAPIDALKNYVIENDAAIQGTNLSVDDANALLEGVSGDCLYVRATIDAKDCPYFGIYVKQSSRSDTDFYYENGKIWGWTSDRGEAGSTADAAGPLELIDGKLSMEIFIDRSLVEAYFNNSKSISVRAYSKPNAQGISFFADSDITIEELYVAEMDAYLTHP